jgi:hypothetical protein
MEVKLRCDQQLSEKESQDAPPAPLAFAILIWISGGRLFISDPGPMFSEKLDYGAMSTVSLSCIFQSVFGHLYLLRVKRLFEMPWSCHSQIFAQVVHSFASQSFIHLAGH